MTSSNHASLDGAVVAFDLDGTLVDTAPDLVGALNIVLAESGLPPHGLDKARTLVGHGARVLIAHGFQAAGAHLDDARVGDLVSRFIAVYEAHICDESQPFPNAVAMLNALDRAGARSVICTNKPGALARKLLQALGLFDRFLAVVGPDDVGFAKPDARHLRAALAMADARHGAGCVMVGDSATDVGAARNTGIPVVVTSFGYTPVPARDLGGDALIDDLAQLPDVVARLLDRALPQQGPHDIARRASRADA